MRHSERSEESRLPNTCSFPRFLTSLGMTCSAVVAFRRHTQLPRPTSAVLQLCAVRTLPYCFYPRRHMLLALNETSQTDIHKLDDAEMEMLAEIATCQSFHDGEVVFQAGQADVDLFVVRAGKIDILNPSDDNRLIAWHGPGEFAG